MPQEFKATAPDGTSWKVTVPDGMPHDQVSAEVDAAFTQRKAGAGKAPPGQIDEPAFEKEAKEILSASPADLIAANPVVRTMTSAAEPIMGAAGLVSKAAGGESNLARTQQLKEMQQRGSTALGFPKAAGIAADVSGSLMSPVSLGALKLPAAATAMGRIGQGAGIGAVSGLTTPSDDPMKDAARGGGLGATITSALEGLMKTPGAFKKIASMFSGGAPKPLEKPVGEGAEKVTGELQRQRDVMEGKKGTPAGQSEYERASTDFNERMTPLREEAFRDPASVNTQSAGAAIEKLIAKNPDKKVRAALQEVKDTIERATESSGAANLPAAGARVTPEQLREIQGAGGKLSVEMADEVRQSINRMIEQKGDAALDAHTKDVLAQVRETMLKETPPSYKKYLQQYTEGVKGLDKYKPDQSVLGKVTSGERAYQKLTGKEAQDMMASVFSGKRSVRDIRQLVESTAHSPADATALRQSYMDFLGSKQPDGRVNITEAAKNWLETKEAVQNAGMFDSFHFKGIDKVMSEVVRAKEAGKANESAASAIGWFLGLTHGHPGTTAMLARRVVSNKYTPTPEQLEQRIMKSMSDAKTVDLMAAPPTPGNIEKLERALSTVEGRDEPPPRRRPPPDPRSMSPNFSPTIGSRG